MQEEKTRLALRHWFQAASDGGSIAASRPHSPGQEPRHAIVQC
ncbi:Unknown protein sequence [Pseudomonas syringae pv. maculicola]|nr:Unknown protein sequence [Pseudomonas syringae pv. maculicola]